MIVSASRRTDIPAFYSEWMMTRLAQGYCTVPNPMNLRQVTRVSLEAADVDAIVFWTRNPRPLMQHLDAIDRLGHCYVFLFTIVGNPRELDRRAPRWEEAVQVFRDLAARVGPRRVAWRYDPIVFSRLTPPAYHLEQYARIAERLEGCTERSIISLVALYKKLQSRLRLLVGTPAEVIDPAEVDASDLLRGMADCARSHGMHIQSCAAERDLCPCGIEPGACIDGAWLEGLSGRRLRSTKDSGQRGACRCVKSIDIGMYDSCLFECQYCYATKSFDLARRHHAGHDPTSPSLLGRHEKSGPTR